MEVDADARRLITWQIKSGFFTADEIIETVEDYLIDSQPDKTPSQAQDAIRPIVEHEWTSQLERQKSWPDEPTISEKLSKAFSSLERDHRILARMNFACCQRCGVSELSGESDEDTRGFVFFHAQDTETMAEGGDVLLSFGSFTKSEERTRAVGDVIAKSLRRAGLSVEWEGDTKKRMVVHCDEWRRRIREDGEVDSDFSDGSDTAEPVRTSDDEE